MNVSFFSETDNSLIKLWDDFVKNSESASAYHLIGWRDVIVKSFGHRSIYLMAEEHGQIMGILPLIEMKSAIFGNYIGSMPFLNYGGIAAKDSRTENILLERAVSAAKERGFTYLELRCRGEHALTLPAKTHKVSMFLELPSSSDEMLASFKSKLRSQIKKTLSYGMTCRHGGLELLNDFYYVFTRNMRDLGTPVYSKAFFANILSTFPGMANISVIYMDKIPAASGFTIGFKDTLEIPWASSLRQYNKYSPNMQLYWEILKKGCEDKYKTFDFGRSSPDSSTFKFKEQWGAGPQKLYWYYWLDGGAKLPDVTTSNSKYSAAIKIWQNLPLAVTNFIGPYIIKNIP